MLRTNPLVDLPHAYIEQVQFRQAGYKGRNKSCFMKDKLANESLSTEMIK